jgi:hypothetical protein
LVLRRSTQPTIVLAGDGQPGQGGRRFGQLRSSPAVAPTPTALEGPFRLRIPPPPVTPMTFEAAEPPVLPFDSTKIFVGPNGTYYDERWRWMEWRGRNRSWNWAAALTQGGWLAYRRLYGAAAVYLAWLGVLLLMLLDGVSLRLTALLAQIGIAIGLGLYGNRLYRASFRRAALEVAQRHEEYALRVSALAGRGGVDRRAAWVFALAAMGLAGLAIGFDR